jgi:hypothetical protein
MAGFPPEGMAKSKKPALPDFLPKGMAGKQQTTNNKQP